LKQRDELLVSIDIGSSKVTVCIAEVDEHDNLSVLGIGESPTQGGMRGGVVINIDSVAKGVVDALEQAEIQAGREATGVILGISGTSIESFNSRGVVAISGADKEIRDSDIARVIEAAKAVAIPMDRDILHIIPQGFTVDGQGGIKYPQGMIGTRLECDIHIITTPISSIQNFVKCIERTGLEIYDIVLQNLAASRSVLGDDEKELGVALLEIGAETTKITLYHQQAPWYNAIYPLGGYLVTNDLAAGLKVSLAQAEQIKLEQGVADFSHVEKEETVQIPSVGGRKPRLMSRETLVHVIRPRLEEMLGMIRQDLGEKGMLDMLGGGIVLCGGSAELPGILEVTQEIFNVQARLGVPALMSGFGDSLTRPAYAVTTGLIRWGRERIYSSDGSMLKRKQQPKGAGFIGSLKSFFDELF
jgi:cell division protein FtsA